MKTKIQNGQIKIGKKSYQSHALREHEGVTISYSFDLIDKRKIHVFLDRGREIGIATEVKS